MSNKARIRRRFTPHDQYVANGRVTLGRFSLKRTSDGTVLDCGPEYASVPSMVRKGEVTYDETHTGPPWRNGGPFTNITAELPEKQVMGTGHYVGNYERSAFGQLGIISYDGGFYPSGPYFSAWDNIPSLVSGPTLIPSTSDWEQAAYIKTRPRLQRASVFVAGAEFRDVPRMLKSTSRFFDDAYKQLGGRPTKLMSPKKVSDDFLNYHFGWVPFISDIRQVYTTYQNNAKIKRILTHDNDKWTRRKVLLQDTTEERIVAAGNGMQVVPAGDWIGTMFTLGVQPTWTVVERKRSTISAVGSYKYYRPEFDSNLPDYDSAWNSINRDLTIYGARISPSNVYRAVPWTWLVDWFTDFGSVVDRITDVAQDGVAAQYLYVMRREWTERILTQVLPFSTGALSISWSATAESKIRRPASTPYGFGLSWHLLSPKQLAILAALKITHMR